jgi:hypothetical protein
MLKDDIEVAKTNGVKPVVKILKGLVTITNTTIETDNLQL